MIDWMTLPLKRYAQFSGRSRPKEYWLFVLFCILVGFVATMADYMLCYGAATRTISDVPGSYWASVQYVGGGPVLLIWGLATLIPGLAVAVRRLHDSDHSGWWLLIGFVPFVGGIVIFVFMVIGGTRGSNRFGPDPVATPPIAA